MKSYFLLYRKIFTWLIITCSIFLILASCDISRNLFFYLTYKPDYKDFPLGRNEQIELEKDVWFKQTYCLDIKIEFIDGKIKRFGSNYERGEYHINDAVWREQKAFTGGNERLLYTLQFTAYKQGQDKIFFQKEFNNLNAYNSTSWNSNNPKNLAERADLGCFELPRGKYHFEISDKSEFIQEFNTVNTSIEIYPSTSIK